MDAFLYAPVQAGFWSHRDVVTDVFTFADLLDAHEILRVRYENEWRAHDWAERARG